MELTVWELEDFLTLCSVLGILFKEGMTNTTAKWASLIYVVAAGQIIVQVFRWMDLRGDFDGDRRIAELEKAAQLKAPGA